jgi:hypothetical protein
MLCPVEEADTDFQAGFRVDILRAHPNYRNAAWHDDVSTRAYENCAVTYGRLLLLFSADVIIPEASIPWQTQGFAMIKWYRRHGALAKSHGMRELRWETDDTRYPRLERVRNAFTTAANST